MAAKLTSLINWSNNFKMRARSYKENEEKRENVLYWKEGLWNFRSECSLFIYVHLFMCSVNKVNKLDGT